MNLFSVTLFLLIAIKISGLHSFVLAFSPLHNFLDGVYRSVSIDRSSDTSMVMTLEDGVKKSIFLKAVPSNIPGVTSLCLFTGIIEGDSESTVTVHGCKDDKSSTISISSKLLPNGIMDLSLLNGVTSVVQSDFEDDTPPIAFRRWNCNYRPSQRWNFCPACPRRGLICSGKIKNFRFLTSFSSEVQSIGSCKERRGSCVRYRFFRWYCSGYCTRA